MKKSVLKVLAMLLVLVMVIGSIPVSAAKTVETDSKKGVNDAIGGKKAATVVLATDAEGTIVIHSQDGAESNKKLVIDAPNANIVNYGSFKAINIAACKSYKEKGVDNVIYVKDSKAKLTICKDVEVGKIVVQTKKATLNFNDGSNGIVVAKKAKGKLTINASEDTVIGVQLAKKTTLTVNGDEDALVGVENDAEGSKIVASTTVYIEANQSCDVNLKEGAEGSLVDAANDAVDVNLKNESETVIIVTIGGEIPSNIPDNASTAAISVEGVN